MEMLYIYLLQHKIIHLSETALKAGYIIWGNKPATFRNCSLEGEFIHKIGSNSLDGYLQKIQN